jgi:hypothetical protein
MPREHEWNEEQQHRATDDVHRRIVKRRGQQNTENNRQGQAENEQEQRFR